MAEAIKDDGGAIGGSIILAVQSVAFVLLSELFLLPFGRIGCRVSDRPTDRH
jgi:hypothetical protein